MEHTLASISGYAFASIIHEASKCSSDSEGLLYGEVNTRNVCAISDSQSSGNRLECDIAIQDTLAFEKTLSFYDVRCHLDEKTVENLRHHGDMKLLGWYKIRRNSTARPSLKEQTVIRRLLSINQLQHGIIFLLVTPTAHGNLATITFPYKCFIGHKEKPPIGIQLKVINLGHSGSHPEYRMHSLLLPSSKTGVSSIDMIYEEAIHNFCDEHGQMYQVNNMYELYSATVAKLQRSQEDLATSEEDVRRLNQDIEQLEERLRAISGSCPDEANKDGVKECLDEKATPCTSQDNSQGYKNSALSNTSFELSKENITKQFDKPL